jgi:hypothetical protein
MPDCKEPDGKTAQQRYREKHKVKIKEQRRIKRLSQYAELKQDPVKYRAHLDRQNTYTRKACLKRNYGLSLEGYSELAAQQKFCCKICGKKTKLHVDHCHTTGKIRGLLCHNCNLGIGNLQDNPLLLQKAIEYLNVA